MNNIKLNKATENLYREYKDHVFNYLYRLSSNYDIALDITQQTFLKILNDKNILSLKSPKAYLFTVARNTLYNEWKKKKEFQLSDEDQAEQIPDEQTAIPDDDVSKQDLKNKIESAIKSLPEKSRELMLLHYSDGLSYQEIVSVTGRKLSDVKVNLHRARHRFESVMTTQMYRKIAASRDQCDEILTLLTPFKNNEIPESHIDIIDAHITSCNICSEDAQQMKRTRQLFSILPLVLAPSILDQLFNQSFGAALASSTSASVGNAANTTNAIATGALKITATKLIVSAAVVAILATGGFLILKKDKLPDNVNSPATPSTTITSNAKSQQSTTQAKSYNSNTDASLEAPKKVFAGSGFKVKWTGPNNDYDVIAVFDKTNPKHSYNYQYANSKSPSKLVAPETPGLYEVIYKTTKGKTLVKIPLTVISAGIKLQTLKSVTAGSKFKVAWQGASNHTDAVSVFTKIKPDLTFNSVYAFSNTSATLTAPEMPGQYEVLYKTPLGRILSRVPLRVISAGIKLQTLKSVTAGSKFNVVWSGASNHTDAVSVFNKIKPDLTFNSVYAFSNSSAKLTAPEMPGQYEVLYKTPQGRILSRTPLTVISAKIKLQALKSVTAGSKFNVVWSGASNHTDAVSVFNKIKPDLTFNSVYAFSNTSATLTAPEMPGQYEVLYKTPLGRILSRVPLLVVPKEK